MTVGRTNYVSYHPSNLNPCKTEKLQFTCHFISHIGIHVRQTDGKLRFISSLILEYVIQTDKLHFTQLGTLWGLLSKACPFRMSLYIIFLSYHLTSRTGSAIAVNDIRYLYAKHKLHYSTNHNICIFLTNWTQNPVLIIMIRWDHCFWKSHMGHFRA